MNWLFYIGGGFLWFGFWVGFVDALVDNNIGKVLHLIASIMVWIWLCWKLI